jgi:large subunit ribosomal protein L6
VDVQIKADQISVKGSGGTLCLAQNALVKVVEQRRQAVFAPANESREANAMSGTMRQLVNNMVVGVSKGFEKKLNLVGVGYGPGPGRQAEPAVGYSHPVNKDMPAGITVATPTPTEIVIKGADRQVWVRWPPRFVRPSARALQGQGHPLRGRARHDQRDQEEVRSSTC